VELERAIQAQRHRLLRVLAGLLAVVAFVSIGPFSRDFVRWVDGGVASVLSRAELAAQYLIVAQARIIAARIGSDVDRDHLLKCALRRTAREGEVSLSHLRRRIRILRAMLADLPRSGMRLLRRAEKALRREDQPTPCPDILISDGPSAWQSGDVRIARPPDKQIPTATCAGYLPPRSGGRQRRFGNLPRQLVTGFALGPHCRDLCA